MGLAFSVDDGEYICVQSPEVLAKRKEKALEKTLSETNFLIRSTAKDRLSGKPDMCRGYKIKNHDKGFHIQCDELPNIDLLTDGSPTQYPTKKGNYPLVAKVTDSRVVQNFDFGKVGFSVTYIKTEKGFDVIKSIYSSYLGAPLDVRASYIKKP